MPESKDTHIYKKLSDKWMARHRHIHQKLWRKHGHSLHWLQRNHHHFTAASLGGLMLLASPLYHLPQTQAYAQSIVNANQLDPSVFVVSDLSSQLPEMVRPLQPQEEQHIAVTLSRNFKIAVAPELSGIRLNTSYGLIGAEQHLVRYPGDSMATHFDSDEEAQQFYASGMAPGRGAFGYFAPSAAEMTKEDSLREKYYIAVQTFMAPGYNENAAEYNQFFKFRKMLVVNPQNGKAVVAVIGDSGPALWTGKQLGGSPEVMRYLERVDGAQRGPVLYFFVDDPNNIVPLGPIVPKTGM